MARDNPSAFDPLLLSQVRLGIMSVLLSRPAASFSDLKALLTLTQGNLGIHLQKLEEGAYVSVKKEFVKRKPKTTCRITAKGRKAGLRHLTHREEIARGKRDEA